VKAAILTAMTALALVMAGCSDECHSICEKYNGCSVSQRATDIECTPYCSDVLSLQRRAVAAEFEDCSEKWQAHLSCWEANIGKICDAQFADCSDEAKAWVDCMKPYCASLPAQNKSDPNCTATGPALIPF
jgi:hypothetical protein